MTTPVANPSICTQALTLAAFSDGRYQLHGAGLAAQLTILPPVFGDRTALTLRFTDVRHRRAAIGQMPGEIRQDISTDQGIAIRRELFISDDGRCVGARLGVKNLREQPVELLHVYPLAVTGSADLRIAGGGLSDWRFVKMCRQKTDVPGGFDFSLDDENLNDAALEGCRITAGGGVGGRHEDYLNKDSIRAEPFFYIRNKRAEDQPGILFGLLGQTEHLTTFNITPTADRRELDSIICDCEFDGVRVDRNEERWTHWALIMPVDDEMMLGDQFTGIFMKEFAVAPPAKKPLTVYCTWQFYGFDFNEQDLRENLQALGERPLPIDVIQLDNGWMNNFGDWEVHAERFPGGMKAVADRIAAAGFIPGIWTCPTMIMRKSRMFREHPELAARRADGSPVEFDYIEGGTYCVDPTAPGCEQYITALYRKLKDWGFRYHKLDFLRSIILREDIRFYDRKVTRAQAYRLMLEMIRRAIGEDGYMLVCGGIHDAANAGITDAVRTGNDMFGFWVPPDGERWKGTLIKIKQNTLRNYTHRLWSPDPDACPIRRRTEVFRPGILRDDLSLGLFTDEEAFSVVLTQYLTGGNVCVCERFAELDEDRRMLYRHAMPSAHLPARVLDYSAKKCPNGFLTAVTPRAGGLEPWWTLAVGNWEDEPRDVPVDLSKIHWPDDVRELAVFEFREQRLVGVKGTDATFTLRIGPHGMRLLRLARWSGTRPVLLGTDLHFTGGGVEIAHARVERDRILGQLDTPWRCPVTITAAWPAGSQVLVAETTLDCGRRRDFEIRRPGSENLISGCLVDAWVTPAPDPVSIVVPSVAWNRGITTKI
ncbi:MAG: glycoside hydrolase family 36 protein [Phycisphaerales bacterium]